MKKHLFRLIIFLLILVSVDWSISTILRTGMERYYGIKQNADMLIIGHSHMMKACNKVRLEKGLNLKIAKYCREGVMVPERHLMLQHFFEVQKKHSVRYVLYGVDPHIFTNGGNLSLHIHTLFYPFMEVPSMDTYVRHNTSLWDYVVHKYVRCSRYDDTTIYRSARGWLNYWESLANGVISDDEWTRHRSWQVCMLKKNVKLFHDSMELLISNGAHVILVYPSVIKSYETSNPEAYAYMMNYFQSLADSSPHIDFLNYAPLISHHQEYFEDSTHINRRGEAVLSEQLIKDVQQIINRTKQHK